MYRRTNDAGEKSKRQNFFFFGGGGSALKQNRL